MTDEDDQLFGPAHVAAYQETDGERGYHWRGTEILLLTTTGRKSGEQHTTPLIHRTDGDHWIVVASKGGAPEDPAWFKNMQANPEFEIQVKAEHIPARMSVAEGEERERLWNRMVEVWPDYENYAKQTDREIPIVVIERR